MTCQHCGAPIVLAEDAPTVCPFCKRPNAPAPREVMVPVPMQLTQNVVQVTGSAAAAGVRELRCPHCRKRLVTAEIQGVSLSGCTGCGGIWIDNESARKVLAAPERVYGELASRAAANARGGTRAAHPICAECPGTLDRTSAQGIELDVCPEHGTWFDAHELRQLTAALRGEYAPAPPSAAGSRGTPTVRCAGCGTTLRADRANVTDMGLRCDGCWRGEQNALIAAADRNYQQTSGTLAAGVLVGVAAALLGATTSSRS